MCTPDSSQELRQLYEAQGVVIVPAGLNVDLLMAVKETLIQLIEHRVRFMGGSIPRHADLDEAFRIARDSLPTIDRELMLAVRESPEFRDLIFSQELLRLVDAVSPSKARHFSMDFCMMRIDTKDSEERRFDWHFDTAYTALPPSAVTCWIPLTRVDQDMGCVHVIPGSHRRPNKVRFRSDLGATRFSGPKRIELVGAEVEELERHSVELPPLGPGDVALFHGWLLHRSGHNITARARWVCNPRFCDLWDREFVESGWKASRSGTPWVFQEQHPELVVKELSDGDPNEP
jgi:ectoine hydroxylase-related dioxygenase (phytanoyl-CoA dioxygenase family)